MKEHPILFSAPMVQSLLAGRKSVTRRIDRRWLRVKVGDVLWVRETWRPTIAHFHGMSTCDCADINIDYAADGESMFFKESDTNPEWEIPKAAATGNVSPLFMPRWASRIQLEVLEDAREVRLQEISEEDAIREGIVPDVVNAITRFVDLWHALHTKPGERWEDDPIVIRVGEFRRVQ